MFAPWLIRIQNGTAYVYQRKYWMGIIAVPWAFTGGTSTLFTPDTHSEVLDSAMTYILEKDLDASIQIDFKPWS